MRSNKEGGVKTMILTSLVISFFISMICTLLLPIVLVVVLLAMRKISVVPLVAGALSFFISQIVLRIPLLQLCATQQWFLSFAMNTLLYTIIVGGFSAGLFEETARLVGASLLKNNRRYQDMIAFGLGHGLCEVVLLVGLGQINNILACCMIASSDLASTLGVQQDVLQQLTAQLAGTGPAMVYLGIVERISVVVFHLFATSLVFMAVKKKNILLYFAAILAHTAFNTLAAVLLSMTGMWICEGVLLLLAVPMAWFVHWQKDLPCYRESVAQTSTI